MVELQALANGPTGQFNMDVPLTVNHARVRFPLLSIVLPDCHSLRFGFYVAGMPVDAASFSLSQHHHSTSIGFRQSATANQTRAPNDQRAENSHGPIRHPSHDAPTASLDLGSCPTRLPVAAYCSETRDNIRGLILRIEVAQARLVIARKPHHQTAQLPSRHFDQATSSASEFH